MKKLFLLDAYALIYRAYYGLIRNPRINSKKQNTSAIFGFVNTLQEILQKERPTHIAVVFDPKGKTFRHEVFPQYKAQREETPEDIRWALPVIKDIIKAYNITILEVPGYEADDVIGTVGIKAAGSGIETYMMTPDKDYRQLVRNNLFIYKPGMGSKPAEIFDTEAVCKLYGIKTPLQVVDILGLMGDAVDNVPGCPGVGEKTAISLMQKYDSIEEIYEDPTRIKGKLLENIQSNKEQVLFSKFLVKIKTDVPIDFNEEQLLLREPDNEKLKEIFKELEFSSILKKMDAHADKPARTPAAEPAKNGPIQLDLFDSIADDDAGIPEETILSAVDLSKVDCKLVENEEEQLEILRKFLTSEKFAFRLAQTSQNANLSKICGLALTTGKNESFYLRLDTDFEKNVKLYETLKNLFEDGKGLKICHDLKFQTRLLRNHGVGIGGKMFDTMLAHYVLQPEMKHDLPRLAETYLKVELADAEQMFGPKWKTEQDASKVDPQLAAKFYSQQTETVLRLHPVLEKEMGETGVLDFYAETELPLALVLADMEHTGVKLNTESLAETSRLFTLRMNEYEQCAFENSGEKFNISSPKQVGEVLFDKLKLNYRAKKTKTGQYVTNEEILEALRGDSVVVDCILKYRAMKKLIGTYTDALPGLINPLTGHIHSSFNQAVTATGRLSSSNPNLQNIPVRGDDGKEIRKAFIPEEGQLFFSADYSQIELRLMAHLSGDHNMIEAFNEGHDIHAATAAKIFHKHIDEVSSDERRKAKTANFGIIYGISAYGLAQRMGVSRGEAKELIDGYYNTYPHISDYMELTKRRARETGYVETLFKRRRYLPDINSHNAIVRGYAERNAVNAPIQGSASDIIKIAMVRIFRRFNEENLKSKMILQVHDELNFSVVPEEKERVAEIVKYEMEHACQLSVPLRADAGWGTNWLEAH